MTKAILKSEVRKVLKEVIPREHISKILEDIFKFKNDSGEAEMEFNGEIYYVTNFPRQGFVLSQISGVEEILRGYLDKEKAHEYAKEINKILEGKFEIIKISKPEVDLSIEEIGEIEDLLKDALGNKYSQRVLSQVLDIKLEARREKYIFDRKEIYIYQNGHSIELEKNSNEKKNLYDLLQKYLCDKKVAEVVERIRD